MPSLISVIHYSIGGMMPKIGGKKFPYTPAGKKAAAAAKKKMVGKKGY